MKNYNCEDADPQISEPEVGDQMAQFRLLDILGKSSDRNLLEFRLKNYNRKLLVSPSDKFIAFQMARQQNWLVCEFGDRFETVRAIPWNKFDRKYISSLIFVDHPDGEKLVFTADDTRLVVFDLTKQRIEFRLEAEKIRGLHYLNREHAFLVQKNMKMGLLWLGPFARVNWAGHGLDQVPSSFCKTDSCKRLFGLWITKPCWPERQ